jgi:hypothetical protein
MNDLSSYTMVPPQMDADALAEMHRQITRRNDEKSRAKLAADNRAAGKAEPRPGDVLYVTPARGIKFRGRAGLRFTDAERTKVVVLEEDATAKPGEVGVSVDGAEQILGDDSLVVFQTAAAAGDALALRAQLDARESELEAARSEIARLRAEARRGAKDPGDGTPARLRAAAAVKGPKDDQGSGQGGLEP